MPFLGNNQGNLLWQRNQWCFQTSPEMIAEGLAASANGDVDLEQNEALKREVLKKACKVLGVAAFEAVYLRIKTEDVETGFEAWTKMGILNKPMDELMKILGPFMTSALGMSEAFDQWSNIQPTEAQTIEGAELMGWRVPNKVMADKFSATFFVSSEGDLKWLMFEGPPSYGLLAFLPILFENLLPMAADSSICTQSKTSDSSSWGGGGGK